MMNKKGFEIQFNWIFVLVAGAAILLFFAAIVVKQKSVSEASTKAIVLKSIDAIITGASVTTETTKREDIPYSEIGVECNRVTIGGVSKQYQNLILFSPGSIYGSKLLWQTASFSVPYRATNLLYITSPQIRYIIIGSSELAADINRSMSPDISKESYQSMPSIQNSNNYKVRFIIFGAMISLPGSLQKMPDSDVTAIKIDGDAKEGAIDFYQKNGNAWLLKGSSAYIGKQSLIGAAYSDTLEMYQCNMKNVFSKLNLVTRVYHGKISELINHLSSSQLACSQFYSKALSEFNKISSATSSFSKENMNIIADSAGSLDNINNDAKKFSCPLIY